jgi:hypothetical protein
MEMDMIEAETLLCVSLNCKIMNPKVIAITTTSRMAIEQNYRCNKFNCWYALFNKNYFIFF